MIALIIIGVLFFCLAAILFLPLDAVINFKEEFGFKVKFSGIRVFTLKKDAEEKVESKAQLETTAAEKGETETYGIFKKLKGKYGFSGAVKQIFELIKDILPHIKRLLKHIKFKRIILNINIAEEDAAKTAVDYGRVCSVAYPVLSYFESIASVKYKAVNISSDFESKQSQFDFSAVIRARIFFLIIAAIKIYFVYKDFKVRVYKDERK